MSIIYPDDGWVLSRAGRELDGLEVIGTYFIGYDALYDETKPRPHGAFFTHIEPAKKARFDEVAGKVDYAVCLNKNIKNYLKDKDIEKVEIIRHGHDPRVKKEILFGFSGRTYRSGRKGEELLKGINVIYSQDFEKQPEFYKRIDYLVIPSRIEGGPVPLLDAMAAGVPVLAREGVGWADEFPCIRFKDDEDFKNIVHQLTNPPTWRQWRDKHQKLFRYVLNNSGKVQETEPWEKKLLRWFK